MGIFSRISTLFKAEANAAIDKMEDPEKVLNQTIRDKSNSIRQRRKLPRALHTKNVSKFNTIKP